MKNQIKFLLVITFICTMNLYSEGTWKHFGYLKESRNQAQSYQISDYSIMVIGGLDRNGYPIKTTEIINTMDSTIKDGPSMIEGHGWAASDRNSIGEIVITGGHTSGWSNCTAAVELYSPITKKWNYIGSMKDSRAEHICLFINDSLLLIVGGETDGAITLSTCELFNIRTGISRYTTRFPFPSNQSILGKVNDKGKERILCVGSRAGRINSYRSNEIFEYDFQTESWSIYGKVNNLINNPTGLVLDDGRFIFSGGCMQEDPTFFRDDIYLESSGSMAYLGKMNTDRNWHKMVHYDNENVMIVGGYDQKNTNIAYTEWLNLTTGTCTKGPSMVNPRRALNLVTVKNKYNMAKKTVLSIGGGKALYYSADNSVEIFMESAPQPPRIVQVTESCNDYTIVFEDKSGVANLTLDDLVSKNTKIANIQTIPPSTVKVRLTLINASINGYFKINYESNSGLTLFHTDSISTSTFMQTAKGNTSLNVNARYIGDTIRLTDNNYNYRGSAWINRKIDVTEGFATNFKFRYSEGKNRDCEDNSEEGADGIAFVVQNSSLNECGYFGGGIGYFGINNAIAFEFDTFANDSTGIDDMKDPNGNHFAIQHSKNAISTIHNTSNTILINSNIPKLINNAIYTIVIDYNIEPNTLRVYLDSAGKYNKAIASIKNFDFSKYINLDNNKSAYIGITSGTGCAVANHDIFDWNLCSSSTILNVENEINSNSITINPNPSSEFIEINLNYKEFSNELRNSGVEIFNNYGLKMPVEFQNSPTAIGQSKIDISNFPAGVYFIRIGEKFEKFVKW